MIKKALMIAAGAVALSGAPALANNFCKAKVAPYRAELNDKADSALAEVNHAIVEIRQHNGNPDNVGIRGRDGTLKSLPELLRMLIAQKAEVSKQIDDEADKCGHDLKPLQDLTDAYVTTATGGLNKLLPERMTHIEIGEILAGKPFGGSGGVIPHFREQILQALNLQNDGGFVMDLLRDPVHAVFPHL